MPRTWRGTTRWSRWWNECRPPPLKRKKRLDTRVRAQPLVILGATNCLPALLLLVEGEREAVLRLVNVIDLDLVLVIVVHGRLLVAWWAFGTLWTF